MCVSVCVCECLSVLTVECVYECVSVWCVRVRSSSPNSIEFCEKCKIIADSALHSVNAAACLQPHRAASATLKWNELKSIRHCTYANGPSGLDFTSGGHSTAQHKIAEPSYGLKINSIAKLSLDQRKLLSIVCFSLGGFRVRVIGELLRLYCAGNIERRHKFIRLSVRMNSQISET